MTERIDHAAEAEEALRAARGSAGVDPMHPHAAGAGATASAWADIAQAHATLFTSQTCSVCGALDGPKPLRVRAWTCGCGARLDRDYNAAVNIMVAAGLAETQNACGADIGLALARAVSVESGTRWSDEGMAA